MYDLSSVFGCLVHQDGNKKYEGVSKMSEMLMLEAVNNCLVRGPKIRMAFGLESDNLIYLLSNTASCVGCFGSELIFIVSNWYIPYNFDMLCSHGQIDYIERMLVFHNMYSVHAQPSDIWDIWYNWNIQVTCFHTICKGRCIESKNKSIRRNKFIVLTNLNLPYRYNAL